jgi:DNA replication protein DnaC
VEHIDRDLWATIRGLFEGKQPWPLFLHGSTGTGKTCAMLALSDHVYPLNWRAQGWPIYKDAEELSIDLIDAQQGRAFTAHGAPISTSYIWNEIARSCFVILDEVGARSTVTDFRYDTVKRVLDKRHGKALAVVSNLPLPQIAELYDDRVASRLAAGTVVCLDGPDRRLSGK